MDLQIEPNQRFGRGFQIRAIDGPASEVYDDEPLTMAEALECLSEATGGITPSKVTARRIGPRDSLREPEVITFHPRPDVQEAVVDGEKQPVVSPRGVILLAWAGWKKNHQEQSKDAMRRYCEYISAHGYRGGASRGHGGAEGHVFQPRDQVDQTDLCQIHPGRRGADPLRAAAGMKNEIRTRIRICGGPERNDIVDKEEVYQIALGMSEEDRAEFMHFLAVLLEEA